LRPSWATQSDPFRKREGRKRSKMGEGNRVTNLGIFIDSRVINMAEFHI
jgi:hypothetical protein